MLVTNLQENPLVDIADDAFKDISLKVLVIRDTLLSSITGHWIDKFYSLKALDKRGVKLNRFSHAAAKSLNELESVYADDPKLCCILRNVKLCHDHISIHLRCSLLQSRAIISHILILTTVTTLLFMTWSIWLVRKLFTANRYMQCLLHNSILIYRSLCVFNVLITVVVDIFHGKHYVFWYTSRPSKLLCQGFHVMFSCGIVMSHMSTSLLDYIAYMAVSHMRFNENDIYEMVKKLLYLMYFLTITVSILITFVLEKNPDTQISSHHLCGAALGVSFKNRELSVTGPTFIVIVILSSLAHSISTYSAILKNAYSSGKRVQTMASTKMNIHRARLCKLLKNSLPFHCASVSRMLANDLHCYHAIVRGWYKRRNTAYVNYLGLFWQHNTIGVVSNL